ncbi:V-type immunoglobulin domain-containing suppressor of T-cell activation [Rhinophrynus dorsalis]
MDSFRKAHHPTCSLWQCWLLLCLSLASYQDQTTAFTVTAPYSQYTCPEGQNVNLTCIVSGPLVDKHDGLIAFWYFTKDKSPECPEKKHVFNTTEKDHHHKLHTHVLHNGVFHITLRKLSQMNTGGYCCYVLEGNKKHFTHVSHSYLELEVKTDDPNLQDCMFQSTTEDGEGNTAAALAIVSCIIGILCIPVILLLVYKQRKAISHRRAQELVRMDSEAQGIENPVFDDPPAENVSSNITTQRPRLMFMASRQPSESDRHLLSAPNTPLSPPGTNECFFPSLEPVPDSPDPEKV